MNRLLKKVSRGTALCVAIVLQMAAVPNSTDAPVSPTEIGAPILAFNVECGMCVDDPPIEGYRYHHFDGECEEVHDFGCQQCDSHLQGCHYQSITDPEDPDVSCADGTECAYARMAEELAIDIRSALKAGADADVTRLLLVTKVPFAIDVKASTARLYGCYGLLSAEVKLTPRLAADISAEAARRAEAHE